MIRSILLIVMTVLSWPMLCKGQGPGWSLKIYSDSASLQDKETGPLLQDKRFDNSFEAYAHLRAITTRLQAIGMLEASVDSVSSSDSSLRAWVFVGKKYTWGRLASFDSISTQILQALGIRSKEWVGRPVQPSQIAWLHERVLRYCENNGYPFARSYLTDLRHRDGGLEASIAVDRGPIVRYDTLIITSDVTLSRQFLTNYLDVHQGDLYDESKMKNVSKKLAELTFVQEARPWHMSFSIEKNELHLFLKEKKSNQLNGIIGLQPNNRETGRFMLTYDLLLGLKNALGYGEQMAASLQKLQYNTLQFHGDAILPYLLGTPLALEGKFELFKRDTAFIRVSFEGGMRYQLNAWDYFKISYQSLDNRLIYVPTEEILRKRELPDNLDLRLHGAAAEFFMERTDYRLNPRKGWSFKVSGAGLVRNVKENEEIIKLSDPSGFDYASLYDSVRDQRYQYRAWGHLSIYIPIFKNLVLKPAYYGGYISGKRLFQNELFQLGGFQLLRGYDEQSIYSSRYQIASFELRLLMGRNSWAYLFNDNGWVYALTGKGMQWQYPNSVGLGVTLENTSGIFNIAIGIGRQPDEGFQFRQSKIHLGYTAYF